MSLRKKIAGLTGLVALTLGCVTGGTPSGNAFGRFLVYETTGAAIREGIKGKLNPDASNVNVNVYNDRQGNVNQQVSYYALFTFKDLNGDKRPSDSEIANDFSKGEILSIFFRYKNLPPGQNIRFLLRREDDSIDNLEGGDYINEYSSASKVVKFICEEEDVGYNEIKAIVNNKIVKSHGFSVRGINKVNE